MERPDRPAHRTGLAPGGGADRAEAAAASRLSRTGVLLVVFAVLVVLSVAATGWGDALRAVEAVGPGGMAVLCGLAGLHYLIRAWRWHRVVQAAGLGTTLGQDMRHFFGGFALTATPGRVGELVRLRWLSREAGTGFGRVLPIALADRAIELASMVLLIGLALSVAGLGSAAAWWLLAVAAVLVWVACRPRLLERGVVVAWRLSGRRRSRLFVRVRRVVRRLAPFMKAPVFVQTLLVGIVGWGIEGVAFWLLLDWLGAGVPLAIAAAIFLVAVLAGALSGLPGGLGGTEVTAVALLVLQGVPADTAVLAIAVIRIATLWFAVAIGLAVFPSAEGRSVRAPAAGE
jgi:uncharacterized protein (TIRG00374 family)